MPQNLMIAIGFALINAFMLSAMSLFAKLLAQYFQPVEITFFRNASSLIILIVLFAFMRKLKGIHITQNPRAHLLRSAIGTAGILVGMWSFSISPLAVATTLYFTAPLFVVLLSYPVLGEKVGPLRMGGVAAGFCGVALIAWPAFTDPNSDITALGVVVGIAYGFIAGCVDICLRWLGKTENSSTTTFYFLLFGVTVTSFYWPFSPKSPLDLDISSLSIIFFLGLTGVLSLLAKSQSFRLGQASLVAPITYTMIIWAGLFDYFVWGKLPGWQVIAGTLVIITSNLFILWRENRKRQLYEAVQSTTVSHENNPVR
jgi:drug/metabolite transporter (DMT)-like permease